MRRSTCCQQLASNRHRSPFVGKQDCVYEGCLGPIASYMDGVVGLGVMVLSDLSYASGTMLTLGFPADVRSTPSVRFLRAFQKAPALLAQERELRGL
jgi:hypothetical protein